ncbi:phospholipase D-like domain-containing protein [Streptomyces griseoluteus]|uniref:phospholipase D-like domain-containing protein n=1 Tax=Streptomyces griseoluteus TaxID=29306 RepID=UPI0037FBCC86
MRGGRVRRVGTVLAVTLLTSGVSATSGVTPAFAAGSGPVFNIPGPDSSQAEKEAIRTRFLGVIQNAVPGSTLKMAMYHLWDSTVAQAMADAHGRGVDVQVIMDSTETSSDGDGTSYPLLTAALGTDTSAASFVTLCGTRHACNSTVTPSINHNKFLIYDAGDGASSTVVQSSSNLTPSNYSKFWNDAMVVQNDQGVYQAYTAYFARLKAKDAAGWAYLTPTPHSPYTYYFFPRPKDDPRPGDTIVNVLDNVGCTYTEGGTTKHSTVRVGMYKITRQGVADKLRALRNAGCAVDIVYTQMDSADSTGSAGTWEALHYSGGPAVRCVNFDDDGDEAKEGTAAKPTQRQIIHSKFLLIEGKYGDGTGRKVMWTGSHNYSGPALTNNDEALLKIDDPGVYASYVTRYNAVRAAASPGTADNDPACKGVTEAPDA